MVEKLLGKTNEIKMIVEQKHSAKEIGSGSVDVFATPSLIALMETCSKDLVQNELEEGMSTVGTAVNIKHLGASKIGAEVVCTSTLKEVDRKRLVFELQVFDGDKKIGEGTHERFIINIDKFMSKL